jgi:hypothetical protein
MRKKILFLPQNKVNRHYVTEIIMQITKIKAEMKQHFYSLEQQFNRRLVILISILTVFSMIIKADAITVDLLLIKSPFYRYYRKMVV